MANASTDLTTALALADWLHNQLSTRRKKIEVPNGLLEYFDEMYVELSGDYLGGDRYGWSSFLLRKLVNETDKVTVAKPVLQVVECIQAAFDWKEQFGTDFLCATMISALEYDRLFKMLAARVF